MSIIPAANSNLLFRMNSIPQDHLQNLEYIFNKYDNITAVKEFPGLSISRNNSRQSQFDSSASFYRENLNNPFIQWQFILPGRMHYQKDLILKRLLGGALAGCLPPDNFLFSHVNIKDISSREMFDLVRSVLLWCVDQGGKYISPYCENSGVVKNWLNGEYGQANVEFCAPTIAVNKIPFTRNDFILAQAVVLVKILLKNHTENNSEVCVVGFGNLTYQLSELLLAQGIKCLSCVDIHECQGDVILLLSMPNCINIPVAEKIKNKILVELLPEQIDPDADQMLFENGNLVLPEFLCDVSLSLLEKFWEKKKMNFVDRLIRRELTSLVGKIITAAQESKETVFRAATLLADKKAQCWLSKES